MSAGSTNTADVKQVDVDVDPHPLIFGFSISTSGEIKALNWEEIQDREGAGAPEWRWIHLNRESAEAQQWLNNSGAPDRIVANALLQADTRPRIVKHNEGYLLNLRGVNLNAGADPEDMISLRMWATPTLVITTRARRILAAEDLKDAFRAGNPPRTTGALIAFIAQRLVSRIGPVVSELDDQVDALEDQLLTTSSGASKANISRFRRTVLSLRRYIAPQREAIAGFTRDSGDFLSTEERYLLRDTHDTVFRLLEDLDLIRERAMLLQEQLVEERAEDMNDRLFVLAIISVIFLPLGFVTGLFGVNVGGIPGVDSSWAFAILCGVMVLFAVGVVILFKRMKWI